MPPPPPLIFPLPPSTPGHRPPPNVRRRGLSQPSVSEALKLPEKSAARKEAFAAFRKRGILQNSRQK